MLCQYSKMQNYCFFVKIICKYGIFSMRFCALPAPLCARPLPVQPNFRIRLRKKIGNLTFELRSLATEGTQEFPPLKKKVMLSQSDQRSSAEIRQNKKGERHPQQNERKLNLQTLKASPLSNRRSERPAEKPPTNNKHSEGVPRLAVIRCTSFSRTFLFLPAF